MRSCCTKHAKGFCLYMIARRSLRSPVDQVMSMGSDYLHKLNACCEVHEADGKQKCYQKSFYDLVDDICTTHPKSNDQPNAIPAIVNCCVQGGNARFRCLYSLLNSPSSGGDGQGGEGGAGGAGGAGGHEVEVCSRAVCEVHDKEGFGYSRR
ncbi:unnamed protein product [Lampetra fluviatilis]